MNFKIKRGYIFILMFSVIAIAITSLSLSYAWFATNQAKYSDDISGSVLESYFDKANTTSGDPGSQTNPFVITTPRHYENLVKLYTKKIYNPKTGQSEYFSDQNYYFEIGKLFDDSGTYKVHVYDKYGADTGEYSTVLDLQCLAKVEPLGNDLHPFGATLEGHEISVQNFTVTSAANKEFSYNDVGIFGYVKSTARVTNCYWDNFVIDATDAVAGTHLEEEAAQHTDNFRIGYLAGHIKTYESFTDCYVNNCSIKSPANSSKQQNDYGYYGMVEIDKTGGISPSGKNYSYSFDSEKIHDYFSANYSAISSQQLTLRNTKEGVGPIDPVGKKVSDAVIRGDTGDLFNSYYLTGKTVSASATETYSLSTIGYVSGNRIVNEYDYETKVLIDGTYYDTSVNSTLSDRSCNENFIEEQQGSYHYYWNSTDNQWDYYFCDNHYTKSGDTYDILLDFDQGSETALGNKTFLECRFDLYLDNNTWGNPYLSWNGTGDCSDYWECVWKCPDRVVSIPVGQHVGALIWYRHWKTRTTDYSYYSAMIGTRGNKKCTMVNLNNDITFDSTTGKYVASSYDCDLSDYISSTHTYDRGNTPSLEGQQSFTPDVGRAIYGKYNVTAPLYAQDASSTFQLKNTTEQTYDNALFFKANNKLMVRCTIVEIEPGSARHFIAEEDEIAETNYKADNIDVVGGGVGFYYYNLGSSSIKVCRVDSEYNNSSGTSGTVVKQITSSDIGTRFYAPGRCNQSIVLYIRNIGSVLDEVDDYLGKMTFNYYQLPFRTVHPSYKKGASSSSLNYVDFSTIYGSPTQSPDSNIVYQFKDVEFTENICKKACYCCLDADGKILGTFNSDGGYDIGMNDAQASKIATFVMVIGSFTSASYANWKLWIRDIQFEYKASNGEGGTFGSVGYRSQGQSKITNTILNFNMTDIAANTQYVITVIYSESTEDKFYRVNCKSNKQFTLIIYNYYPDTYKVYVNGSTTPMSGRMQQFTIPASSTSYPNFT